MNFWYESMLMVPWSMVQAMTRTTQPNVSGKHSPTTSQAKQMPSEDIFEWEGAYYARGRREAAEVESLLRTWALQFKINNPKVATLEHVRGYWYYSLFEDQNFTEDPRSSEWTRVTLAN